MSRILISLAVLLVLAAPVSAQYTLATIADCPNDGKGGVCVVYSGQGVKPTDAGDNRYFPRAASELSFATTARKAELNGLDTAKKVFAPGIVVADAGAATPTTDDLAAIAFQELAQAWKVATIKVSLGIGTQGDVISALAALASAYSKANDALRARLDAVLFIVVR